MTPGTADRIAVVIPAYNAANFIRAALDSVLAQTLPAHEILVVDDGSKDETCAIVEAYAPRVTLLRQANAGPARARNLAVRTAESELIAFLDADDAWAPEKLQRQVEALRSNPGSIFCYTRSMLMHADGRREPAPFVDAAAVKQALRSRNPSLSPSCVMVTREALLRAGGFDEQHRGSEDWQLWFRLSRMGEFCSVADPLTLYTVSTSGLSGNADHMMRDFEPMLPLLLSDLHGAKRGMWRRRILSEQCMRGALTARAAGQMRTSVRYNLRALLLWPSPRLVPYRGYALLITLRQMLRGRRRQAA